MVRPVRRARPDAPRRARRWAGPPPLLLLVTVIGFVIAPMVDREPGTAPRPETAVPVSSVPVSSVPVSSVPQATEPDPVRPRTSTEAPVRTDVPGRANATGPREQVRLGVASMSLDRSLTPDEAADDARRLVDRPGLDLVGWREADRFGAELRALPGWDTRTFRQGGRGLAVSWRSAQLELVAAGQRQVGSRPVAVVTLRHRDSGRLVTVVDARLPQPVDGLDHPGRRTPGRWVVGTGGDVAALAGSPRRIEDPTRGTAGSAVSSYLVLGTDLVPTFRSEGRRVAVVYVDRDAHQAGRVRFAGRWVVRGFAGDHDALVTRLVLS